MYFIRQQKTLYYINTLKKKSIVIINFNINLYLKWHYFKKTIGNF